MVLVPVTTGTIARITSTSPWAVSGVTMHEALIGRTLEQTFPNSSLATAITDGKKVL
jgi:hypothetical protein